jgi:hypothetical protein
MASTLFGWWPAVGVGERIVVSAGPGAIKQRWTLCVGMVNLIRNHAKAGRHDDGGW